MKISVIMPVYNCSKIVPDTINSVLSQTLTDFEFIIIDDGSIDDTLSVVKSFADERIRVISVKNGGPAVARNIGIENATGEYLYFIDSDDTIEKEMLFDMYNLSKQNDLDICCCGYKMRDISTKKEYIQEFKYKDFIATNLLEFRNELMGLINAHLMYVVWNKLYKTDFVKENNITFPNFKSGEDRMFNIKCFINIKRFAFVNKGYYNYYIRGGKSLASKYLENRYESVLKTHLEMEHSFKFMGMYDKYKTDINFIFIKGVMSCFVQLHSKGCPLTIRQKGIFIKEILKMPWVKESIKSDNTTYKYSKIVNKVLRTENTFLISLMSKCIYLLQNNFNWIYLKYKFKK